MPNHTTSLFRSNRLSTAFSSRVSGVFERFENRRSSDSPQPYEQASPNATSSNTRSPIQGVQNELDIAILAEEPTEPYLLLENKYPSLRSLRTDEDIGDGLWICCHCRHENILRHFKGPHPFKYLNCNRCSRTLCSDCHTTEILTPWAFGLIHARPPTPVQEVRYCQVCTGCGLSHRAEMEGTTLDFYGATCAGCGNSSWNTNWARYHIGNVEPYRRDPNAAFATLVDARAEDAAKLAYVRNLAETEALTTSDLECRNPD